MVKYHVAAGDGNGYYGVGYESYRQAESLLKISQEHDPQAYIVEEEYLFTNADRIRAMSDEELADNWMRDFVVCHRCAYRYECECDEYVTIEKCREGIVEWLKQPAEEAEG